MPKIKLILCLLIGMVLLSCTHMVIVKDCTKVSDELQKCVLVDED